MAPAKMPAATFAAISTISKNAMIGKHIALFTFLVIRKHSPLSNFFCFCYKPANDFFRRIPPLCCSSAGALRCTRKNQCHYTKKKNFINTFSFLVIFFAYFTMFSSARRKKCRFAAFSARRRRRRTDIKCRRPALCAKNFVYYVKRMEQRPFVWYHQSVKNAGNNFQIASLQRRLFIV